MIQLHSYISSFEQKPAIKNMSFDDPGAPYMRSSSEVGSGGRSRLELGSFQIRCVVMSGHLNGLMTIGNTGHTWIWAVTTEFKKASPSI